MSPEGRENALCLAQQMLERDEKMKALIRELKANGMLGLECGEAVQLEGLAAENAVAGLILARWLLYQTQLQALVGEPQISLVIKRPEEPPVQITRSGNQVTPTMLEVGEELLHTLNTGERKPIQGLYDLVARAFGTTREDAKTRLTGAAFGKQGDPPKSNAPRLKDPHQ